VQQVDFQQTRWRVNAEFIEKLSQRAITKITLGDAVACHGLKIAESTAVWW